MPVPAPLRPLTRPVYRLLSRSRLRRALVRHPERSQIQNYWRAPWDGDNAPESYVEGEEKSGLLVDIVGRHMDKAATILELGCNVGRNLHYLHRAGFTELAAIEISEQAVAKLRSVFPDSAATAAIELSSLEDGLARRPSRSADLVFSMAVLEHIHEDSAAAVFRDIARVAGRYLVTIEDEKVVSWRHFPRRYDRVFEPLGLTQIEAIDCDDVAGLGPDYVARVFAVSPPAA
jgi:SAM-dependent methyltransferase